MRHRISISLALLGALSLLPACGLFNGIAGPPESDSGTTDEDGGGVGQDAGDAGGVDMGVVGDECSAEGTQGSCANGEICITGRCEARCSFGPAPNLNPVDASVDCASPEVCIPSVVQETSRLGYCVSAGTAETTRAAGDCEGATDGDDYCKMLLRDGRAICNSDESCQIPCDGNDDCRGSEYCDGGVDGGYCLPDTFCSSASDPSSFCELYVAKIGLEAPNGAYCLGDRCLVRRGMEGTTACTSSNADGDSCDGNGDVPENTFCPTAAGVCVSRCDEVQIACDDGLACAYLTEEGDPTEFACVAPATLDASNYADPIAVCTETGRHWNPFTNDCETMPTRPAPADRLGVNAPLYAYVYDSSTNCANDLTGNADPGPDVSFVGLSSSDDFENLIGVGRVTKIVRPPSANSPNTFPGYSHIDGIEPEADTLFTPSNGNCIDRDYVEADSVLTLGCGTGANNAGVLVEFVDVNDPNQLVDLGPSGPKYIVVSEVNAACDPEAEGTGTDTFRVAFCDTGFDPFGDDGDPVVHCTQNLVLSADPASSDGSGPTVFQFPTN